MLTIVIKVQGLKLLSVIKSLNFVMMIFKTWLLLEYVIEKIY